MVRMKLGGFLLLDTQFVTEHLQRFGAIEIPRDSYRAQLARAIAAPARFHCDVPDSVLDSFVQSMTQRS
jgi:leucyl/phenylalanyl-tRNA--protein transferase